MAAPYVGPPKSYTKGRSRDVQYVVIHTTEGSEGPNSAEDGVAYDKRRTDGTSTHLFGDQNSVLKEVHYYDRAHAARFHGNEIGIQFEICGVAGQTSSQWDDAASRATLDLAAREIALICAEYSIPVRRLSVAEVRNAYYAPVGQRPKGLCGHVDVTHAYPEDDGSHTDPGSNFPWERFMNMIKQYMGEGEAMIVRVNENGALWTTTPDRVWRRTIVTIEELNSFGIPETQWVKIPQAQLAWYGQDVASVQGQKGDPGDPGAPGAGFAPGQTVTITGPVEVQE